MDPTTWAAPYPVTVTALFAIVMIRANATYWLGRAAAAGAHRTRVGRWMDSAGYVKATSAVNNWGAPAVSVSFLTIGVQTLINLAAGATRMPLSRYLPAVIIGSVAWALVYATVGFVGFEALGRLYAHSPVLAIGLGAGLLLALGAFLWWRLRARPASA